MGDEHRPDPEGELDKAPEVSDRLLGWIIIGVFVLVVGCCTLIVVVFGAGLLLAGQQAAPTLQRGEFSTPTATQQAELNKLAGPPEGWERTTLQFGKPSQWHSEAMAAPYGGKLDITFNDADEYVWDLRPSDYSMSTARTSTIGGEYRDFYIAVDVVVDQGEAADVTYGLLFRQSYNSYYRFGVSEQRNYLADMRANSVEDTFGLSPTEAINPTLSNHLVVLGKGSKFWLFINGQYVGGFESSTLGQGGVGIFATCWDSAERCVIRFTNFEAYKP